MMEHQPECDGKPYGKSLRCWCFYYRKCEHCGQQIGKNYGRVWHECIDGLKAR